MSDTTLDSMYLELWQRRILLFTQTCLAGELTPIPEGWAILIGILPSAAHLLTWSRQLAQGPLAKSIVRIWIHPEATSVVLGCRGCYAVAVAVYLPVSGRIPVSSALAGLQSVDEAVRAKWFFEWISVSDAQLPLGSWFLSQTPILRSASACLNTLQQVEKHAMDLIGPPGVLTRRALPARRPLAELNIGLERPLSDRREEEWTRLVDMYD